MQLINELEAPTFRDITARMGGERPKVVEVFDQMLANGKISLDISGIITINR